MDFTNTLLEVIDLRSFSNLWYWIALAVLWSSASHWVLGVPYDMIQSARRHPEAGSGDMDALAHINARRMRRIVEVSGLWLVGIVSFVLTVLAMLATVFGVEFAQAVFLLAFPMLLVGIGAQGAARRVLDEGLTGEALVRVLLRQRLYTQLIGIVAIFLTAMWGMYQNLALGALG